MAVSYEWVVEQMDGEDIVDAVYAPKLIDVIPTATQPGWNLALVRNDHDGYELEDRQYAYPVGGKLPTEFPDGTKVPKRFFKEVARATRVDVWRVADMDSYSYDLCASCGPGLGGKRTRTSADECERCGSVAGELA